MHNHKLPTLPLNITRLPCVISALYVLCTVSHLKFQIFFLRVTANQVSWSLSPECSWFPAHIWGLDFSFGKSQYRLCQLVLSYPLLSWHPQGKTELQNWSFLTIIPTYPYIVLPVEFTCPLVYFFQDSVLWRQSSSKIPVSIQHCLSQPCPTLLQSGSTPQTFRLS